MDIVELPPLGRRIEWPTIALAIVIYGLWFVTTYFWRELPWWALAALGAWIIAWQMNLQHEVIHGHPTPNRRRQRSDRRLAARRCGCPFRAYRTTHLRHHQDANLTDPFEDPESYYWTPAGWRDLGAVGRALAPVAVDAARARRPRSRLDDRRAPSRDDASRRVARQAGGARSLLWHCVQCVPVLIWVIGVCGMPFWVYVAASSIPA